MLNSQELDPHFVKALEQSWDEKAIWPDCKNGYIPGKSHKSYGQCLVGTLNAWVAHGGSEKGYHLVPGRTYGPCLSKTGVWHFQLAKDQPDGTQVPIDVTWDQFEKGSKFKAAPPDSKAYQEIMTGSLLKDASLVERVGVISKNLASNGFTKEKTPEDIVKFAQEYFQKQLEGAETIVPRRVANAR